MPATDNPLIDTARFGKPRSRLRLASLQATRALTLLSIAALRRTVIWSPKKRGIAASDPTITRRTTATITAIFRAGRMNRRGISAEVGAPSSQLLDASSLTTPDRFWQASRDRGHAVERTNRVRQTVARARPYRRPACRALELCVGHPLRPREQRDSRSAELHEPAGHELRHWQTSRACERTNPFGACQRLIVTHVVGARADPAMHGGNDRPSCVFVRD